MFSNDCNECKNLAKSLEKKQETLTIYQTNLYEIKARIINENTLLNNYKFFKNENEQLKKEIEQIKSQSVTGKNSQTNYEIELLRNKYLKELDNNKNLLLINNQLTAIIEDNKNAPEQRAEFIKMKKDLSEKERKINNLLLLNENLKKEIKEMKTQLRNREQDEKSSHKTYEHNILNQNQDKKLVEIETKDNIVEAEDKYNGINFNNDNSFEKFTKNSVFSYDNIPITNDIRVPNGFNINRNYETDQKPMFNTLHNLNSNLVNNNQFGRRNINKEHDPFNSLNNQNIKEILKENEFLKNKFQKYEKKYIKHKSLGKSYKKLLKNHKKDNAKEKELFINKLFEMKLKTTSKGLHLDNLNTKLTKNIKLYKNYSSSSEEEEKSESASNHDNNSEQDLFINEENDRSVSELRDKMFKNNLDLSESKQHKEKSLESLLNNSDSERMEKDSTFKNKNAITEKSSKKISSIKNMIAKMKSENNANKNDFKTLSNNERNHENDSIDLMDFYKKGGKNLDENGFESLSDIESEGMRRDNVNPMIDNFNNDDKNFLFLKKKIIRKKAANSKKINDEYEQFKEDNANERRSMRIKINSLKTDNKIKVRSKKNYDKKEDENKPKVKADKEVKNKTNGIKKKEKAEDEQIEDGNNKDKSKSKAFAFSIAEMLKRNREGENVSFQVTNICEDHNEKKNNDSNNGKIKAKMLEETMKRLKEEAKNSSKNKIKKASKKEFEKDKNLNVDEAEMLFDVMEIPKSNDIIKVPENKGSHKNPLKFNKKITASEITEIKTNKIKSDLLEYVKNKINLFDIYKNIKNNYNQNSFAEEISSKYDLFSLVSFDIQNIFNQKIEGELTNNMKLSEYSIYEKINFIFDLILEAAESLEIGNVFIFVFSFLKNLMKEAAVKNNSYNSSEVYEIIFGYFTVKINELISDESFRNKCFMNSFSKNISHEGKNSKEAIEIVKKIFEEILLSKENENLLERIFIRNELLNIQTFFSFNFVILFYLGIENFYEPKNSMNNNDENLIIDNFNYFRLMQEFLLNINYNEKSQIGMDSNSNRESLPYEILQKIFELFCLLTDKFNIASLLISDGLYDKKLFSNSNKIMFAENLKDKVFTSNFFYIIRKIFLCDSDQINFNLQIPLENSKFKAEEINGIKKQNLILQVFGNLYLSFISNINDIPSSEKPLSFRDFNNKNNILKAVELTQFIELATKIHKIPIVYGSVFEQVLWPEFTKQGQTELTRRLILYLISILFKFVLKEDSMFKFDQTKNLMNWLYAIIDPKFDVEKIIPIDRIIALYGLMDLCRFDQTFANALKTFLIDILNNFNLEEFPIDLKEKLFNKFGIKIETLIQPLNNLVANEDEDKKDTLQRIIVENR